MSQQNCLQMIDERSSSPILRKTISEPQTGIEPATFWWPVRHSNHWATKTQMASQGASSTYMCDLSGSHYILIMIDAVSDFRNVRAWIYLEIDERSSSSIFRKTISEPQTEIEPATFWWPVRRSNHWATKTQMESQGASSTHMCDLSRSHLYW